MKQSKKNERVLKSMTEQRQQAVSSAISHMKAAIGDHSATHQSLDTVLQQLLGLAATRPSPSVSSQEGGHARQKIVYFKGGATCR